MIIFSFFALLRRNRVSHDHRFNSWFIHTIFCLTLSVMTPVTLAHGEADDEVVEYRLSNGLTILVKPIFRAPVVSSQLWYKVGSSYEHSGISGISHMLEHMMFKGTEKYPSGTFASIVAKSGGSHNAFTSRDFTAYYQNVPAEHLAKMLELEADRMRGIVWKQKEFDKEVKVVIEERRLRTDDNPNNKLHEAFYAHTFTLNPYRIPVIGWMIDIVHYRMEDAKQWFQQWYGPNNAVLVVVGAVQATEVKTLAERFFAHIPVRKIPPIKPRIEPPERAEKRYEMLGDVTYSSVMMGYKVPSWSMMMEQKSSDKDVFALELIAAILDAGGSSRLLTELVHKQRVASRSGAFYHPLTRLGNLFVLNGVTAEGKSAEQLESALLEQVERLQNELISESELTKVKTQIKALSVYSKDSLFYQGYELGVLEAVGIGWERAKDYLYNIENVSAEDIKRVAKKYFTPTNRSLAILKPVGTNI